MSIAGAIFPSVSMTTRISIRGSDKLLLTYIAQVLIGDIRKPPSRLLDLLQKWMVRRCGFFFS